MDPIEKMLHARPSRLAARRDFARMLHEAVTASGAKSGEVMDFVHGHLLAQEIFVSRSRLREVFDLHSAKECSAQLLEGIVGALDAWNRAHADRAVPLDALRVNVAVAGKNSCGR